MQESIVFDKVGFLVLIESLSGDQLVLGDCDVLADAAEGTWSVIKLLGRVDALTQREGVGIVEELHLRGTSLAHVDSADTWVLLVQPRALNIGLLLRIVGLGVHLSHQVGDLADSLLLSCTQVASSQHLLLLIEVRLRCLSVNNLLLTKVVSVLSVKVAGTVSLIVLRDDSAET